MLKNQTTADSCDAEIVKETSERNFKTETNKTCNCFGSAAAAKPQILLNTRTPPVADSLIRLQVQEAFFVHIRHISAESKPEFSSERQEDWEKWGGGVIWKLSLG